jgi:predicted nuclease of predicted toxin-antitoxin system
LRFLVDAQLPPALVGLFKLLGHEAEHVIEIGLETASDRAIWSYAKGRSAIVVTKDADFQALRVSETEGPAVVWIRIGNTTTPALLKSLSGSWQAIADALERGEQIIEVIEDR